MKKLILILIAGMLAVNAQAQSADDSNDLQKWAEHAIQINAQGQSDACLYFKAHPELVKGKSFYELKSISESVALHKGLTGEDEWHYEASFASALRSLSSNPNPMSGIKMNNGGNP